MRPRSPEMFIYVMLHDGEPVFSYRWGDAGREDAPTMNRVVRGARLALDSQRRACMTWMYSENNPASVPELRGPNRHHSRDPIHGRAQRYDPDWTFAPVNRTMQLRSQLHEVYAKERLNTYKLERMDYEVREVHYGTAPPPPAREVSTNVTLDLL